MSGQSEVFFLRSGLQGNRRLPLQEDLMKADKDHEQHTAKGATIQIPESCTQRLWAVFASWKKPTSFILLNQSLSEKKKKKKKNLHRYYKERQNHWKYFQVWVLPQRFCKSREKYWWNMQICYNLFLLLEARGHIFKQQPWIFH